MKKKKKNKEKRELSYRAKYGLLMSGSILATITPLLIVIGINYKVYFTVVNSVKLYVGLVLGLAMIIIVVVRKLKLKKIMWLSIVFGVAIFFESIFKDIVMLTGALLGGGILDELFFARKVRRYAKLIDYKDQADIQAEANKETNKELVNALAEVIRSGRV